MNAFRTNPGIERALGLATSRASLVSLSVLAAHVVAVVVYAGVTGTAVAPRRAMVPLTWVAFAVWLVVHLREKAAVEAASLAAVAVGVGYFLLLAAVGGVVSLGASTVGVGVEPATPGWGPLVFVAAGPVAVAVVPFEVVGYVALSYGVSRAVAATSRGALAGLVGLFACIGCTLPLVAAVASVFAGVTLAIGPTSATYDLATGVFVLTVVLLAAAVPTTRGS